jgi:hypothetical protein
VTELTELTELDQPEQLRQLIGLAGTELLDQLAKLTELVKLAKLIDQVAKLNKLRGPVRLTGLTKLIEQVTKLNKLGGLIRLIGLAELPDQVAKLNKLSRLAKLAGLADALDQLAKLVSQPGLVNCTRVIGLVGLKGLEQHALLLVERLTGLALAHRNSCDGDQTCGGNHGGSPRPQLRPESLHCVVTCPYFHGMPSLLAAGDMCLLGLSNKAGGAGLLAPVPSSAFLHWPARDVPPGGSGRVAPLRGSHGRGSPLVVFYTGHAW